MKIHIVGGNEAIKAMFAEENHEIVNDPKEAELLQFTGGADVSPILYGQPSHSTTFSDISRDEKELEIYAEAIKRKDPPILAGICRGAQFLHVMNGGTLFQDVKGHATARTHTAWFQTPGSRQIRGFQVTSTHHQMMKNDSKEDHEVLGHANVVADSITDYDAKNDKFVKEGGSELRKRGTFDEMECLYYPSTRSLCFQPHPEYVGKNHSCRGFYFELLDKIANEKRTESCADL